MADEEKEVVNFTILSEGQEIPGTYQVVQIHVDKQLNRIPSASFRILDGDVASQTFDIADSQDFIPGKSVEIKVGYGSEQQTIFKGIVMNQAMTMDATSGGVLEVNCKDETVKMTVGRNNAYFADMKDSDIMSALIANHGLTADVASTSVTHAKLVQYYSTDWDFMLMRADVVGMVVLVDDGTVALKTPELGSAVSEYTYGNEILDFRADLNAIDQLSGSQASAWDIANQELVSYSGTQSNGNSQGNLAADDVRSVLDISQFAMQTSGYASKEELEAWSTAQLLKADFSRITGSVTVQGDSGVKPGDTIQFSKVGQRYEGMAYVSSVEHSVHQGAWSTIIEFGITEEWFAERPGIQAPYASGLMPGVSGLMTGVVDQLDQDPDGEYRIKLTLPLMQDDTDGVWARLSTFYATNGKGIFFIPEIGDEVVVGFMNGDPRYPVILGSLYSSSRTAPIDPTSDNFIKAIITNSECKMEFDDENKIITVVTPGENKMVISDKDKGIVLTDQNSNEIKTDDSGITVTDTNGNKIVMSSSGIEINSASDIKMVASGNVEITPSGNLTASATGNVDISGVEISQSANAAFSASGQASAEISSSGSTSVKGSMVMIN